MNILYFKQEDEQSRTLNSEFTKYLMMNKVNMFSIIK